MAKPKVHIYLLSRLAFADVTEWHKVIKQSREGRKGMYWSYKPMRDGAFRMAASRDANHKSIYSNVAELAESAGGDRCRKANLAALEMFEKVFLPSIGRSKSNFMQGSADPVEFGDVQLIGGPHFSVVDANGRERYVYLHPSKWDPEEELAFCELLTVIAENRFDANARDVWFLDLRSGKKAHWTSSKRLVRRKCERAAELLVALQTSNLAEDEG